jgi:hypothetical protein
METRTQRVVLETARYRIVGELTLPSEGYRGRLSDMLNRKDVAFVAIINAQMSPIGGGDEEAQDFILVARDHVEIAYELSE